MLTSLLYICGDDDNSNNNHTIDSASGGHSYDEYSAPVTVMMTKILIHHFVTKTMMQIAVVVRKHNKK